MIERLIHYIKNKGFEERLFAQFLFLVTLPLIAMGVVSYFIYLNGESAKHKLALDSYGENAIIEYESVFSFIRQYYLNCTSNAVFTWLVRQEAVPYSNYHEVNQAQDMLSGNYFMSKYIDSYNFINVKEGWVLNQYGMFDYERIRNREAADSFLDEQRGEPASIYWLNQSGVLPPYSSAKESRMVDISGKQLIIKNEYSTGNMGYLLMIKLNMEEIEKISKPFEQLGYDITVQNGNMVLVETSAELTDSYLRSGNFQSGLYESIDGEKYNIMVDGPSSSGLTYLIGYNTNRDKVGAAVFLYTALALIVLVGILMMILRLLARSVSKPFVLLQKFVIVQTAQIHELFVSNLIKGELDQEKIAADSVKYEIIPCCCYRMLVVRGKDQVCRDLITKIPGDIRELLFITPICYEKVGVFLIGADDDYAIDYKTASVYKQIKDFVFEGLGFPIASGISRTFHKLINTSRAYSECLEALYHSCGDGNSVNPTLVLYDDFLTVNTGVNVYDIILEDELCNAIASCNEEEGERLFELILGRLELRGVLGFDRDFYLTRLVIAVLSVPVKAAMSLSEVFDGKENHVFDRIHRIYHQEELLHYMKSELLQPITKALADCRNADTSDTVRAVTRLIRDNKGNITLNECADSLNYHPNHITKLLRKEKDITFTDLVSSEKIKHAKYMLLTTDCSIAEISARLQYNNVQNFNRFFKRQLGITPSAFRKEHRE